MAKSRSCSCKKKPQSTDIDELLLGYQKMVFDFMRITRNIANIDKLLENDLFYESVVDAHDCTVAALRKIANHYKKKGA